MSLKLNERYPGRFDNPSADYPQGAFKNRTAPDAKDGSYLEKDWANDKEGFFQSLLAEAGVAANGLVDKVGESQYYDALIKIFSTAITPPQFDISQKVSTTEFVQRALGNKRGALAISASRAITVADFGCEIVVHALAGITLTLPGLASVPHGASIRLVNLGQAPCTFVAAAGESFNGAFDLSATATSFVLQVGDEVSITDFASHWMVIGSGSVSSSYGTTFGSRDLGAGLILQWGTIVGPTGPANDRWDLDVTFPRAFPTKCFGVVGTPGVAAVDLDTSDSLGNLYRSSRSDAHTGIPTSLGFEVAVFYTVNPQDSRIYTWYALGN